MLIVMMLILSSMKRMYFLSSFYVKNPNPTAARANAYYDKPLGLKCKFTILALGLFKTDQRFYLDWREPYSFFNREYKVEDEQGNVERIIKGTTGRLLGEW